MFLSWWYLKANSMKSGQYGTFLCHIYFFFFSFGRGGGLNISSQLLDFFPDPEWMSPPRCRPSRFFHEKKHCTPPLSLKSSMWETSWSVKLESPTPPPLLPFLPFTHLLVTSILESGFMNWTISCFCFLRHGSPSQFVLCQLYPQSPAFLVLPTMHTCLICPLVS